MDKNELKIMALLDEINQKASQIADLRVEVTLLGEELKELKKGDAETE